MKNVILSILLTLSFIFSTFAQNDAPIKITFQPRPELPQNYGTLDAEGSIILRVEFMADGQIGKVSPISNFIADLDQKAVEVARKIKFNPAMKNGQPVTSTKMIQYFYSWDGGWKAVTPKVKAPSRNDEKAEAIIKRAVEKLGGERYLQVKTQVSTGNFTPFRDGFSDLPNGFIDVISFPDKERTEFKQSGNKIVQTNLGETGWLYDAGPKTIREQNQKEIEGFKRGQRTSLDSLLRGVWRTDKAATLTFVGRREAGIGKRNDVIKLTYADGFAVEFEFDGVDGMPVKAVFKSKNADNIEAKEEERYGQFVNVQGILAPFIVDRFIDGKQQSRINYLTIEFNKPVPDAIFVKPNDVKEFKKDLKL
jgi:TonB family protein